MGGLFLGAGTLQQARADMPVFDLIIVDDPPEATPASLTLAPEPEPQRPEIVALTLRPQSDPASVAPQSGSAFARELAAPVQREMPHDDPVARLASLTPPATAEGPDLDARSRLIGTDITPPEDEEDDGLAALSPEELARELQTELARVGCYRMRVDGQWGPGSRRALSNYLTRTSESVEGQDPSPELIRLVRTSDGEVCPAPVAQSAPQQPARSAAPARQPQQPAPQPQQTAPAPAPSAPSSSGRGLSGGVGGFR